MKIVFSFNTLVKIDFLTNIIQDLGSIQECSGSPIRIKTRIIQNLE